MKNIFKIKLFIKRLVLVFFLVFMNLNTCGQYAFTGIGRIDTSFFPQYIGLEMVYNHYILMLDSIPVTRSNGLTVNNVEYFHGDIVKITGKLIPIYSDSTKEYYLEIETIEKWFFGQNFNPFYGIYLTEGMCEGSYTHNKKDAVMVEEGIESDLLITLESVKLKAFVVKDSFFIPYHTWNVQWGLSRMKGKGRIINDSIFIQYEMFMVGVPGEFNCNVKGKKIWVNIPPPIEPAPNKVYYNAVKQELVIDERLQNQSLTLELYDIQGKIILRTDANNPISIAHLSNGVYVYRLLENKQVIGKGKVVK